MVLKSLVADVVFVAAVAVAVAVAAADKEGKIRTVTRHMV